MQLFSDKTTPSFNDSGLAGRRTFKDGRIVFAENVSTVNEYWLYMGREKATSHLVGKLIPCEGKYACMFSNGSFLQSDLHETELFDGPDAVLQRFVEEVDGEQESSSQNTEQN